MASLRFLIDNMCAKFTLETMHDLVKARVAEEPCTIDEITRAITESDRSLDTQSAQKLARAAVEELTQSGDLAVQGDRITGITR